MRYLCLICLMLCGCASFEYDIVKPAEFAQHVGGDKDVVVNLDPLRYYFRSSENRLAIQVYNAGSTPVDVVGRKCSVVDPDGVSHPVKWAAEDAGPDPSIAPGSNLKLILPPFKPKPRADASFNGAPPMDTVGSPNDQPGQLTPQGLGDTGAFSSASDEQDTARAKADSIYYWDWDGQDNVQLTLVFQQGDRKFSQEFLFHKKRM